MFSYITDIVSKTI